MKDLRYLLLLIAIVAFAHATKKNTQEKTQAKFLPDIPDTRPTVRLDSSNAQARVLQAADKTIAEDQKLIATF